VKLYRYCFDTRLAVVYDAKFTSVLLSDVLLSGTIVCFSPTFVCFLAHSLYFLFLVSDDFGWNDRMKVATQLADLFSWLHDKGTAVGCVTASCIMIDEVSLMNSWLSS